MADWFKFFENDLDETRLQYAIHKLPEVTPVWVGILSECCRHKSDTIRWGSNEIELFGFSHRLNISIPKVNEAINLLCEIEYICKDSPENTVKVLRWNTKQSEYCQKKAAKKRECPDSVPTVSGECRPRGEEKRVEEKRGERIARHAESNGNGVAAKEDCVDASIPTQVEVSAYGGLIKASPATCSKFFSHYNGKNLWLNQHGRMINWRHMLADWRDKDEKFNPNGNGHSPAPAKKDPDVMEACGLKWARSGPGPKLEQFVQPGDNDLERRDGESAFKTCKSHFDRWVKGAAK